MRSQLLLSGMAATSLSEKHGGRFIGIFAILFLVVVLIHAADKVENLIDEQKQEMDAWTEEDVDDDALPPVFLLGNKSRVELYSEMASRGLAIPVCQPFPFDELVQLSRGMPGQPEVVLNTGLIRVRDVLSQVCLVRPGDFLMAVDGGKNTIVQIKELIVSISKPVCPEDSPYVLLGRLEPELNKEPFFFLKEMGYKEGNNEYRPAQVMLAKEKSPDLSGWIQEKIPLSKEYKISVYEIKADNCDYVLIMRRDRVSLDDAGLPGEMIYWVKDKDGGPLLIEKVEKDRKSGHVSFYGAMDFNHDKRVDLVLYGDQDGCPYKSLYIGLDRGFQAAEIPNRPCVCR